MQTDYCFTNPLDPVLIHNELDVGNFQNLVMTTQHSLTFHMMYHVKRNVNYTYK